MKTVTLCGITFSIEDDDLVASREGAEIGRTAIADAIRGAKWLRVLAEFGALPEGE